METVTLTYNPNSSFAIALLNLIKASGEVTVVETKPAKTTRKKPADDYAKEIARRAAGVKGGKIKKRPIEELLAEA